MTWRTAAMLGPFALGWFPLLFNKSHLIDLALTQLTNE